MNFAVQSTISLFPWNEKLLVVTCVKTFFYLYPWEPCSSLRPHRMLSTQHFDSPRTLPGAYWDSVRHRKVSQNITGGSKPRGSTYRPPFESLKQTFVQAINPSIAYLLHIWQKNPMYFPPVVKTRVHASRVYCGRLRLRSVSAWSMLCTLFARGDAHTDVV